MAKIPRIFHFVFGLKPQTEPFHIAHYICLRSCLEINKPDAIYFHCHYLPYGEWWDRIKDELTIRQADPGNFFSQYQYKDKNLEKYRYAHSSDIIRLQALIEHGGLYADMDTLFINPIPERFYDQKFILGHEKLDLTQDAARKAGGSLCNAWIASQKGAAFGSLWLERITGAFDGTWSAHSTFLPYRLSQECPELVSVEPERSFFHFSWTREGIANIFSRRSPDLQDVYSIHLWAHEWWDPKRRDFSKFNNERLTPAYIRFANTTYAISARPFLPADCQPAYLTYLKERVYNMLDDLTLPIRRKLTT